MSRTETTAGGDVSNMIDDVVGRQETNVLLSRRNPPSGGWVAIDEFEELFRRLDGARILCPEHRSIRNSRGRMQSRVFGPFIRLDDGGAAGELLLVIARAPSDLRMLYALTGARKRFRKIAGYVIDSYFTEGYESSVREYDHVFSTTHEGADFIRSKYGVSSSVLYQGFDCLAWANVDADRSIDLIGFGRQPPSFHREFQSAFHTTASKILYLHSPIGARDGAEVWVERPMMMKLLQRSKISLAFHLLVEPEGVRPRSASFVTSRWFESLGAGCLILGKRPPGQMATDLFCWPNALVELPDTPSEAVNFIKTMLSDVAFIRETRARNVVEMCRRHDWRHRVRNIYEQFQLPLPERLTAELGALDELANQLELGKRAPRAFSADAPKVES
jgi:hypothetical protein